MGRKIIFLTAAVIFGCSVCVHAASSGEERRLTEGADEILEESMEAETGTAKENERETEQETEITKERETETEQETEITKERETEAGPTAEETTERESGDEPEEPAGIVDETDTQTEAGGELKGEPEELSEEGNVPVTEKEAFYHVSFPAGSKAYFDPENLSGRGQVFSERYEVINYGNTDIAVKIKNIKVCYRSAEDVYEFVNDEVAADRSGIKKMNINMVWENEAEQTEKVLHVSDGERDETVLILRASVYDGNGEFSGPAEGSTGAFYFTGTINPDPDLVWKDGEITVRFDYEIVNIEKESRDNEPAGSEN